MPARCTSSASVDEMSDGDRTDHARPASRAAVPDRRSAIDDRSDPGAGGQGNGVGLHAPAPRDSRRRGRRDLAAVRSQRSRTVRGPDAGPDRGARARVRRDGARPPRDGARRSAGTQRESCTVARSTAGPPRCTNSSSSARRPVWAAPRRRSAICSWRGSSAHPGGGVHGACGSNAARAAIAHDRLHKVIRKAKKRP